MRHKKVKEKKYFRLFAVLAAWIVGCVVLLALFSAAYFTPATNQKFYLSYSAPYARYLGLDDRVTLESALTELKPERIRLVSYWYDVEQKPGIYDFSSVDWQIEMAQKYNTQVVLAIGHKLPRWPECSQPDWYNGLSSEAQQTAILDLLKQSVEHYKKYDNIIVWQVENEAFLGFGANCPKKSISFLKKELELVKSLDPRPTLSTDSGELGRWIPTALARPDMFGSTLYLNIYSKYTGYFAYPLLPQIWWIKGGLLKLVTGVPEVVGVELQAEPWNKDGVLETSVPEQLERFNEQTLKDYTEFAKKVGFSDYYLWGVEWWYWMKVKYNYPAIWEAAKEVIQSN